MRIRSGVLFFRLKQDESVSRQILLVVLHLVAGVRIGCKASRELYGAGRHRKARDLGIVFLPAVESITRGCGLIRHPDLGAVLVGNSSRQLACARGGSAVIIAYFIAVARVVNFQNQLSVACDHACENVVFIVLVEPEALIALCLRRRRCIRDAGQVRFCFTQSIALAVQILRPVLHRVPGIGIRGKGTRELHRAGGHFEACRYLAVLEPAVKRIARGRGRRSHRYIRTIFVGRGGRKRTCACGHCARVSIAHFIAVARVVQLQHQAAVARDIAAGNRALHGPVKCKACISLRVCRRSGIGLACQVFGIRLHKVVTVARQVLLIMLHCISGIAVGRERTGNGHVFGGHCEVLFLAPAAERVARGRGGRRHRHRRTVFHSRLFRQRARACGRRAHISIGHFIAVAVVFDLNHRAAVRGDGLLNDRLRRKAFIALRRSVRVRPGRAVQGLPGRRIFSITVTCHILQHVLDGIRRVRSGAVNDLHGHTVLRHCACYRCNAGRITRNQRAGNAVRRAERDIPGYRLRRLLAPQCCVGHVIGIFVGDIQRIAVHRVVENDFVGCIVRTDRDGPGAVSRHSITRDCGRRFRHRLVKLRGHVFFRRRAGYRRLCAFQIIVNAVRLVVGRVIHVDHRRAVFRNIRGKRSPGCNAGVPGFVYDVRRHQASGLGRARNSFRQRSIAAVIVVDRIRRIRDFLIIERNLAVFAGGRLNIAGTLGQLITADRRGIYQQAVDRQVAADNILGNLFRGALNIMMHRGRPVLQLVIDEHYFLPVIQNFDVLAALLRLITVNDRRIYSDGRAHFHFGAIDAFELIALRVLRHDDIGAAVRARPFRMERQVADDLLRGHERNGVRLVRIPAREHVALTGGVCGHLVLNRVVFRHADGRRSLRIRTMRVEGNRIIRLRPLGVDLQVPCGHRAAPVHRSLERLVQIPAHEHIVAVHTGRPAHAAISRLCAGKSCFKFQRSIRNASTILKYEIIAVAGIIQPQWRVAAFFPAVVCKACDRHLVFHRQRNAAARIKSCVDVVTRPRHLLNPIFDLLSRAGTFFIHRQVLGRHIRNQRILYIIIFIGTPAVILTCSFPAGRNILAVLRRDAQAGILDPFVLKIRPSNPTLPIERNRKRLAAEINILDRAAVCGDFHISRRFGAVELKPGRFQALRHTAGGQGRAVWDIAAHSAGRFVRIEVVVTARQVLAPVYDLVGRLRGVRPLRRHRRGGGRHRFGNKIPPGERIAHLRGVSRSRHRSAVFQHLRLNIAAAVGVPREQVAVAVVFYFHDRFAAGRHLHLGDGQSRKALHRFRLCGGVQARGALQRFTQRFVFRISGAFHVLEQVLYRVIPGGAAVSNNDR